MYVDDDAGDSKDADNSKDTADPTDHSENEMYFSVEEQLLYANRYEEGYDIL